MWLYVENFGFFAACPGVGYDSPFENSVRAKPLIDQYNERYMMSLIVKLSAHTSSFGSLRNS